MKPSKTILILSATLALTLAGGLITSLFFKPDWLWMDEVLSYLLVSDPSIAHANNAVVSGMDANPPLFVNVYWYVAHFISLNPQFLRAVSICLFAITIALFYRYVTRLTGKPVTNFFLITAMVSFTYLNLMLATQIRAYSLFLLISVGYFICLHQLVASPRQVRWLATFVLTGILLVFTHNFGLFYVAASGVFSVLLLLWSRQRNYLVLLGAHAVIGLIWLLVWYPNFVIQTDAGKPHSWIPLPTFVSFFYTVGELAPAISSSFERQFFLLPILRFTVVVGLFAYVARPRLRDKFEDTKADRAFTFYLLAGFLYFTTLGISLVVSLVHTSVFISRYLWPSHLLLIYQLVYAFHVITKRWKITVRLPAFLPRLLPIYALLVAGFLFYQNRKVVIFPSDVTAYLSQLDKRYPVFVETADYFLPIWFHNKKANVHYLLNWETAAQEGNNLTATVEHKILKSVREKYNVAEILPTQRFNRNVVPHFYMIDEDNSYQIEHFIQEGQVRIVREMPIAIKGHRLLECAFQ